MSASCLVAMALAWLCPLGPVAAHHDVATGIARFTERIENGEDTPELFYQRATEYRALHKLDEAEADLRRALARDPGFTPAHRELARLLAARGKLDAALKAARSAVEKAGLDSERAAGCIILARIHAQGGQNKAALRACEMAFALRSQRELHWYLLHAELLAQLGRHEEGAATLKSGHAATHSIVLRNAWLDALLDSGKWQLALPIIEKELASSRLKSSWLLRRARAYQLGDRDQEAEKDLHACLQELERRIHPTRPDLTLIADRGLAMALLGDFDAARADLTRVQRAGLDPALMAPLKRALKTQSAEGTDQKTHQQSR